jgi:hypothetical protein
VPKIIQTFLVSQILRRISQTYKYSNSRTDNRTRISPKAKATELSRYQVIEENHRSVCVRLGDCLLWRWRAVHTSSTLAVAHTLIQYWLFWAETASTYVESWLIETLQGRFSIPVSSRRDSRRGIGPRISLIVGNSLSTSSSCFVKSILRPTISTTD